MNNCKAVIAAAGMSSRMGEFKPLMKLGNGTFLSIIIETFQTAGVSEFIIVTGNCADKIRDSLLDERITFVHNPDYAKTDMFTSVKLGLAAAGESNVLFSTADSPVFSPCTVKKILLRAGNTKSDVIIPAYNGEHGHPVYISRECIDKILMFSGEGGLRSAIASAAGNKTIVDLSDPGVCMDADTPDDYERLVHYYEKSGLKNRCMTDETQDAKAEL